MKPSDIPKRCFQGVVPAAIATCDLDGVPNVTYLSQVFYVDDAHVALSCQFFNKTKRNVLANPHATVQLLDPLTVEAYRLELRYHHAESEGALFETMSVRIEAIASHIGMKGIFKLLSADVYDVVSVEKIAGIFNDATSNVIDATDSQGRNVGVRPLHADEPIPYRSEMHGLQCMSQRVCRAKDLDGLLNSVVDTLAEVFGFEHSMVLMPDEGGQRLFAIASRGYGEGGIGAEVGLGEGLIGTVARERCILRVAGVGAELRYGRAIRASIRRAGGGRALAPEIPLPGLVDAQSQMAIPLVVGDRLLGVIAVESPKAAAFEEWHEAYVDIIANQVAIALDSLLRRAREIDDAERSAPPSVATPPKDVPAAAATSRAERRKRRFRFFASDDCVFAGDDYLVRNLPGRILWKLLREHQATGRTEFTNRELRLDASLGLPAVRDNLESRLVLLRKRLEQKACDLALVPIGRGLFRLDVCCDLELESAD